MNLTVAKLYKLLFLSSLILLSCRNEDFEIDKDLSDNKIPGSFNISELEKVAFSANALSEDYDDEVFSLLEEVIDENIAMMPSVKVGMATPGEEEVVRKRDGSKRDQNGEDTGRLRGDGSRRNNEEGTGNLRGDGTGVKRKDGSRKNTDEEGVEIKSVSENKTEEESINSSNENVEKESIDTTKDILKRRPYIPMGAEVLKQESMGVTTTTINFAEGVVGVNGHLIKGQLIIKVENDQEMGQRKVTQTYKDFSVDDNKVTGTNVYMCVNATETTPKKDINRFNTQITLVEGNGVITRSGTKTRELIEGANDRDFLNNVYRVTGGWKVNMPNEEVFQFNITKPLIRKMQCKGRVVEGTITITQENEKYLKDYGDGSCPDNLQHEVIRVRDNQSIKVRIRKRKKEEAL